MTLTIKDAYGNTVVGYTGTINFASTDGQSVLPSNYTFVSGDSGVRTFTNGFTLKTSGSQTITSTDTNNGNLTVTTPGITVNPGSTAKFVVTSISSPTVAGSPNSMLVSAEDTYGNVTPSYTGTVHFTSSDTQAGLPANYAFTSADQGIHLFSPDTVQELTANNAGGSATVTVPSTSLGLAGQSQLLKVSLLLPSRAL